MAVPENARAGQQPDRPKDPHASTLFFTALAHEQPPGRGNAAAAGRRASVPSLAAASQNRRHSKRQHDDVPRPTGTPEQRRAAFTTRSVQPSGGLPHTLERTAPLAGKPVAATTEGVSNPASAAAVRHEERPPSMRLATGGIQAVGGHEEDVPEGAVACVLVYMCVVVFGIAGLLIYVYRSLSTPPPEMEPCTYEATALTATKPSVQTRTRRHCNTATTAWEQTCHRTTFARSQGTWSRSLGERRNHQRHCRNRRRGGKRRRSRRGRRHGSSGPGDDDDAW
nr:uncharacterized protein LOC129380199 [Dermacentor andersoni]